jgi:hypothetical protein
MRPTHLNGKDDTFNNYFLGLLSTVCWVKMSFSGTFICRGVGQWRSNWQSFENLADLWNRILSVPPVFSYPAWKRVSLIILDDGTDAKLEWDWWTPQLQPSINTGWQQLPAWPASSTSSCSRGFSMGYGENAQETNVVSGPQVRNCMFLFFLSHYILDNNVFQVLLRTATTITGTWLTTEIQQVSWRRLRLPNNGQWFVFFMFFFLIFSFNSFSFWFVRF